MLTPEQLRDIPEEIVQIYIDLEDEIISDIARRISKTGAITETAEYQINILKENGITEDEINKKIEKVIKEVNKVFDKTYENSVSLSISQDALIYEQAGKDISNLLTSSKMIEIIEVQKRKTMGDLRNLTKTLGFIDSSNNSKNFKDINKFLYDTLNYTQFQIASGAFSPDYVIKQAVRNLADSGLRTIDYNSGRSNALDVAIRRATLTGIKQTTGVIGLMWADELDCDIMEITAHSGARPSHSFWQGKLVSRSGQRGYLSLSDIGYGEVVGFKGANCRHDWNPFYPGISSRNYTDEELKNIDHPPFEYEGKTYNSYQANQRQRQMETSIRQTKRRIIAYEAAGAKDMMTAESVKLRLQRNEYVKFSKVANLRVKSERHQVLGYNRSISSKSVWASKSANKKEYLNERLDYVFKNGEKSFIPTGAEFISTKTIAKAEKIRIVNGLINKYGGEVKDWSKKVGKIESAKYVFDVHWFEKEGKQFETKVKERRDKN